MKSPFPGMDPYMEPFWSEVHARLIAYSCDQIQARLPEEFVARIERRVFVESYDDPDRHIIPDVHIVEKYRRAGPRAYNRDFDSGGVAVAEPFVVRVDDEPTRQGFIEIHDRSSNNRVITVIEFMSPSNKVAGEGQKKYVQKRRECREAGVNLVEIDLTRAGTRQLNAPIELIPGSKRETYMACVSRSATPSRFEIYPMPLRKPLPAIRIPLRKTDRDTFLELQPLIDSSYANGRYGNRETYAHKLVPPLDKTDAEWADELLKSAGLRGRSERKRKAV